MEEFHLQETCQGAICILEQRGSAVDKNVPSKFSCRSLVQI